ncbi:MAG TPA: hypothetical protein VM388_12255 [Acidimicrobiales bacterium]|jgi:hypothetical protein|nr:hypothetical protein [Acidimicrobiales bacterium]
MTVAVVVLLFVVSAVVAATVVVRTQKRKFAEANVVVPGTATKAPAEWAGAHTPEARLHRRLRDAVAAVRANPAMEDAFMMDARVSLEQQALAVDERLIAVAALPEGVRAEPLASVRAAVDAVEAAVAQLVAGPEAKPGLERAMAEVEQQVSRLEQGG